MESAKNPIIPQIRQFIETERSFGIFELPRSRAVSSNADKASAVVVRSSPNQTLRDLERECRDCMLCSLSRTRTHVVFGTGNPKAQLMFVGEAPGFDEDKQGLPFVGAAGQLLTKIIEAMKLKRADVYIANCLKCRPPGNRNPVPTEIAACAPVLMRQIEMIRPKVICALGKFAAQTLLETQEPISRLRGRFFSHPGSGIKLMPTFHPAYLLRNPADKKLVWEDMQKIMTALN